TCDTQRAIGFDLISNRMLHKSISDQNEISGYPTSQGHRHGSEEMISRTESLLSPNQRTNKSTLQKEREHPFHRQRLPDHTARISGEVRPVRSELKLHRNTGDDAHGKVEAEDLGPELDGLIVFFITSS